MRILLFADGAWAASTLVDLLESGHTVVAVVLRIQPSGSELEDVATKYGIPILRPVKVNDPEFVSQVQKLCPELGISIAYNQIFRRGAYDFLPAGLINFHAGRLPFYRGRNVVNWAILNGEKEIGLTSHFVDDGIDTGEIILQKTFPIGWTDGYGDVLCRIVSAFPAFVCETIELIEAGKVETKPQAAGDGTYFPGRGPDDEWLDWNDTSFNLHNKVRAITRPGPGAKTLLDDIEVRIWRAYYDPSWKNYIASPGVVVGRAPSGVSVKTHDSVLLIEEIQLPGRPPERPSWRLGTRLGFNLPWLYNVLSTRFREIEGLLCSGNRKRL
jgi:methionyl-tRNA formyltransferase